MFHYSTSLQTGLRCISFILLFAFVLTSVPASLLHAQTPPESEPAHVVQENPEPDATIETGDSLAIADTETSANTNDTELEVNAEESETPEDDPLIEDMAPDTDDKNSEQVPASDDIQPDTKEDIVLTIDEDKASTTNHTSTTPPISQTLTASSTNNATTTTNVEVTADTGNNNANGNTVSIDTGEAVAISNVLNVVNTNVINSDGLVEFVNDVLGYNDFDIRDTFEDIYTHPDTANTTTPCNLSGCDNGGIDALIDNTNNAYITNNVSVTAQTGGNSTDGDVSSINTGNAYAASNILNVANSNITDSNYLLLVFNNFDDYAGDILLPNSTFFNEYFAGSASYGDTYVENNNQASIQNSVTTVADTGGNNATGTDAHINTGSSISTSIVENNVNTNLFNQNSFSMLIRVQGDWDGEIFGLPEGISWKRTNDGIQLYSENDEGGTTGTQQFNDLSVQNTNQATIENDVQVFALTGDNEAEGASSASINTGSAQAHSNITNFANTNVVGSNWSTLIFNIYGNWSGDIAFGQPDLWVGARAESDDSTIMPNSDVEYTFTIFNNGDTDAQDVVLNNSYAEGSLSFSGPSLGRTLSNGNTQDRWDIGTVRAGETIEVRYSARVGSTINPNGVTSVPLIAAVSGLQPDANDDDNADEVIIFVGEEEDRSSKVNTNNTFAAKFNIEKTADKELIAPGETVAYNVNFYNRGGQLFDALLVDILRDEEGTIIQEQSWPLETIRNGEDINIAYSVEFSNQMATGTYTNTAQLFGYHKSFSRKHQTMYASELAQHTLEVGTNPRSRVLGASTTVCEEYLTTYMRPNTPNLPSEVMKLQNFLNDYTDNTIQVTGIFDLNTEIAVRNFQKQHKDEILTPWGLERDSGYVYYTTKKKINEIYCNNTRVFAMNTSELAEITAYRHNLINPSRENPFENTALSIPEPIIAQNPRRDVDLSMGINDEAVKLSPPAPATQPDPRSLIRTLRSHIGNWFTNIAQASNF